MSWQSIIEALLLIVALLIAAVPLGRYMLLTALGVK